MNSVRPSLISVFARPAAIVKKDLDSLTAARDEEYRRAKEWARECGSLEAPKPSTMVAS
jgi:hypothetical protein